MDNQLPGRLGLRGRIGVRADKMSSTRMGIRPVVGWVVVHFVGPRVGLFDSDSSAQIEADKSLENAPSVLFDAVVLPDGREAMQALADNGQTMAFIRDPFRHCKTILALGAGRELLAKDVALAEGGLAFALLIGLQFAVSWSIVRVRWVCGTWRRGNR